MNIKIEAILTHEELIEIISDYVRSKSGKAIEKYNVYVSHGSNGDMGGKSTPNTVNMIFQLQE